MNIFRNRLVSILLSILFIADVCGTSRAGLLTGRHQERFGFSYNPIVDPSVPQNGIPGTENNIAEVLKPAGFTRSILGKWPMETQSTIRKKGQ